MTNDKQVDIPAHALTQHYELLNELGNCYTSLAEYDRAKEQYDQAAQLAPDEAMPYVGLGVIAMQQGNIEDAELAFKVAKRLNPVCSRAWCGLAMVHQQKQNYALALDNYLKCLELDSDNLTALLGLFQTSIQMGSFSKVIYYLDLYLNSHPADIAVMFCLATLYHRDAKLYEARKLLLDILALDPDNRDSANLLEEVEHKLASKQEIRI